MGKYVERSYLRDRQYSDDSRLQARIALHEAYSTNPERLMRWLFRRYDVPAGARVLDIGCGPGSFWLENRPEWPHNLRVVMGDFSRGMLSTASARLADAPFVFGQLDAAALPFPANHFDMVIANFMLYHLPQPAQALVEIRRVLRPGGHIYAATNGAAHMRGLREIIRELDDKADVSYAGATFNLENGKSQLEALFSNVTLTLRDDDLVVTESEPLSAYILSMDRSEKLAQHPELLHQELQARIGREGFIRIEKAVGYFSASKVR